MSAVASAVQSCSQPCALGAIARWKNLRFPDGAILHYDATKNKPLLPVTYNGKYLVVKNV